MIAWIQQDLSERGVDSPRLDAELMVAHALSSSRIELYLDLERPLTAPELDTVRSLLRRRRQREPMAYLLGQREFYGRPFHVTPSVLIPRPETETLVERAIEILRAPKREDHLDAGDDAAESPKHLLDIGTGSGAIAISIACELPTVEVDAIDISPSALEVAKRNAESLGVLGRIRFSLADMKEMAKSTIHYDLIVSNPPYISSEQVPTLMPEVSRYEPSLALDGGTSGLDFYEHLACIAEHLLKARGQLLLEIGDGQAEAIQNLFHKRKACSFHIRSHPDLAGILRVLEVSQAREELA